MVVANLRGDCLGLLFGRAKAVVDRHDLEALKRCLG